MNHEIKPKTAERQLSGLGKRKTFSMTDAHCSTFAPAHQFLPFPDSLASRSSAGPEVIRR
jgi:hypothetical protein